MTRPLDVSRSARGAYNKAPGRGRGRRIIINARIPVVREFLEIIETGDQTDRSIVDKAGVASTALSKLRHGKSITLHNFVALTQAAGLYVVLRRNPDGQ